MMAVALILLCSCGRSEEVKTPVAVLADGVSEYGVSDDSVSDDSVSKDTAALEMAALEVDSYGEKLDKALLDAYIPADMGERIRTAGKSVFLPQLEAAMLGDPFLSRLVDKQHALPDGYEPDDIVTLNNNGSYRVGRDGLRLRREAAEALEVMAKAARASGVTLVASSAYRSFDYQVEVYNRNVRENGQETADRESSRPGFSQHQLGLAIDFGSITDAFAQTAAGRWIFENAPEYGWIISFPDGYERLTGYRWESWHYRYMGLPLASFIERWFGGIQQYALQFIHAWRNS
jgi:D-alanyl-D-alanine carboxypeptidase